MENLGHQPKFPGRKASSSFVADNSQGWSREIFSSESWIFEVSEMGGMWWGQPCLSASLGRSQPSLYTEEQPLQGEATSCHRSQGWLCTGREQSSAW